MSNYTINDYYTMKDTGFSGIGFEGCSRRRVHPRHLCLKHFLCPSVFNEIDFFLV